MAHIVGPIEIRIHDPDYELGPVNSTKFRTEPLTYTARALLSDGTYFERDLIELVHEAFRNDSQYDWTNRMWNYTGPWYPGSNKAAESKKIEDKPEEKEKAKDEQPKKRRNLTSWPPTPE
jgi:hypothetical protein